MKLFLLCFSFLCVSNVGRTQVNDKIEPKPDLFGGFSTQDDFVVHHGGGRDGDGGGMSRKVRSTSTNTNPENFVKLINFSNLNITDTRLSEFLIKVENSTTTTSGASSESLKEKVAANASDEISLNLSQNRLTNLQSDYFANFIKNLYELDVSQNQIVSMNLSSEYSLSQLRKLNLSHNNLDNFPTNALHESLPQMKILDLSSNKLNSTRNLLLHLPPTLGTLDLSCNTITSIDDYSFANASHLLNLDVSFNAISELRANTFFGLQSLEQLNLASNNIAIIHNDTFLPIMQTLQFLDVSDNNIQIVAIRPLQGISNLIGLSIAYNAELGSSLQGFVATWSLKELDGSGIGLCEIPAALTQSVKILNLADNHLQVSF